MIDLKVSFDAGPTKKYLDNIQKKVVRQALTRSLNKTLDQVKTQASRDIAGAMGMKVGAVKKRLKKIRAGRDRLSAVMRADHYAPNLIEFGARQLKKGVSHKAWNRRQRQKGVFIIPGKHSGKGVVVARRGKGRTPLKTIYGPTLRNTFVKDRILKAMKAKAGENWKRNFDADFKYYLSKVK